MSLSVDVLTTLSTVKDELGITTNNDDALLERYISQASEMFRTATGRNFHYVSGYTEDVAGYKGKRLTVEDHLPIDTINSIKLKTGSSQDTVEPSSYEIEDAKSGYIRHTTGRWRETTSFFTGIEPIPNNENLRLYTVDYDGGYVTPEQESQTSMTRDLPFDIEDAVIDFVTKKYREQGQNPNIDKESVMSASVSYADTAGEDSVIGGTTEKFTQVVNRYTSAGSIIA